MATRAVCVTGGYWAVEADFAACRSALVALRLFLVAVTFLFAALSFVSLALRVDETRLHERLITEEHDEADHPQKSRDSSAASRHHSHAPG